MLRDTGESLVHVVDTGVSGICTIRWLLGLGNVGFEASRLAPVLSVLPCAKLHQVVLRPQLTDR